LRYKSPNVQICLSKQGNRAGNGGNDGNDGKSGSGTELSTGSSALGRLL
jgi:hypothetical protein